MIVRPVYEKCDYSIEDLELLRDKDGFIDLTKIPLKYPLESKEKRGNQNRIKNWVDFHGTKALIKGEIFLDEEPNYGYYAELIVEEMAKTLNIPTAHYDLVKIKEGLHGVMTTSFFNMEAEDEELISLHELMKEDRGEFIDATDFYDSMVQLEKSLEEAGYSNEVISSLLVEYQKRLAFDILTLQTDNHIENISFLQVTNLPVKRIQMSPNYDKESSLLLDYNLSLLKKMLEDYSFLVETSFYAQPRIGIMKSLEEGGLESFWEDTLEALIESDEIYDYCVNVLAKEMDMDLLFETIEKRIHAPLKEEVKLISKHAYLSRLKAFRSVLNGIVS